MSNKLSSLVAPPAMIQEDTNTTVGLLRIIPSRCTPKIIRINDPTWSNLNQLDIPMLINKIHQADGWPLERCCLLAPKNRQNRETYRKTYRKKRCENAQVSSKKIPPRTNWKLRPWWAPCDQPCHRRTDLDVAGISVLHHGDSPYFPYQNLLKTCDNSRNPLVHRAYPDLPRASLTWHFDKVTSLT